MTETDQVKPQGLIIAAPQPAETFTGENHGPMLITPLAMELAHGNLQDALQNAAHRTLGFVPELFKTVVAGVPIAGIEALNRNLKARVGQQLRLFSLGAVATG